MSNSSSSTNAGGTASAARPPIYSFHHPALRCFDSEETRHFYADILGLEFSAACVFDNDGLGNKVDFMHTFFRMGDGDFVAFFDLPDDIRPDIFEAYRPMDFRIALKVSTEAELLALAGRLAAAAVKYSGPFDHGFIKSIYFKDPNGLNLEIAAPTPRHEDILAQEKKRAREVLAAWTAKTAARKAAVKRPHAVATA